MPEKEKYIKLDEFIKDNNTLFSAVGVCLALSLFSSNLSIKVFSMVASLLFFLCALLILIELFIKIRKYNPSISLVLFENLIFFALLVIVFDLMFRYFSISVVILSVVLLFLLFVLAYLLFSSFRNFFKNKARHWWVDLLFYLIVLLFSLVLAVILIRLPLEHWHSHFLNLKSYLINFIK